MNIMAEIRSATVAFRSRAEEVGPLWILCLAPALLLVFAKLAEDVTEGDLTHFDRNVLLLFRSADDLSTPIGPAWLQEAARDITSFGSVSWLGFVFFASVGFLWLGRKRDAALLVLIAVAGGQAISTVLKIAFERPRPDLIPNAPRVFTASFPSGHAMLSAVTYLTLGALLTRFLPERQLRIYVLALAVFLTVVTGVSRVYLGVHWPSDVLAGWSVGAAWALTCWLVAVWFQRHNKVERGLTFGTPSHRNMVGRESDPPDIAGIEPH